MKAYRFKLKPTKRQIADFEQWLDVCRELYNAGLQERRDAYRMCGVSINYHHQALELPEIKAIRGDVAQVNAQVLQDVLRRLSKTFDAFFRRCKSGEKPGFPRFKGRDRYDSFTFPQMKGAFRIEGNRLHLSKLGKVRIIQHRPIEGEIKTCTIKREADGWYAIFTVEESYSPFIPKTGEVAGVDLNISNFATLSTGEVIDNPRFLRTSEKRLVTAQRKVSRRKKGSQRRKKAARLLAKQHLKIKRQRLDFFHKATNQIIREFDEIAVEDLNIKGLLKNHRLAKSISDAAWGTFLSILTSKAEGAGRRVWKVPPQFSSQDCSRCGNRVRKSLAVREHRCIACGLVIDRDHNAALNIKARASLSGSEKVASHEELRTSISSTTSAEAVRFS
ncbi:MAG: transposase [Acidobacteriota bacterium]